MTTLAAPARAAIASPSGSATLVVDPLAASLRRLRVAGVDLVEPTDAVPGLPGMAGATLAPWPNRVEDATWWHEGRRHDLDVSEPELGNANHGLLAGRRFDVLHLGGSSVVLGTGIRRLPGYPFDLDIAVCFRVDDRGATVTTDVVNVGSDPAPAALGAHPYLRLGDRRVEQLLVSVEATHAYRLDERHIPRERSAVTGTAYDLTAPRPVADAPGHATFVREGGRGELRHVLAADDGSRVELWADPQYRWTQLYRADAFPSADGGTRTAVAIEPMTAPPNALRTGEGLRWLAPGERWNASWGIRLHE